MNQNNFSYSYSAKENEEIKSIRDKYIKRPETDFEKIKRFDRIVKSSGQIESISIGTIGSLVFGIGLCFGLDVFAGGIIPAVILCILGCVIALTAWPIYKRIHQKAVDQYVPEIIKLTDQTLNNEGAK